MRGANLQKRLLCGACPVFSGAAADASCKASPKRFRKNPRLIFTGFKIYS